jgi:hypothetical protein
MKFKFANVISLCLLLGARAVAGQKSDLTVPKRLLHQSYALSQKLSGNERLFYLTELTRISTHIDPGKTQELCLTMFHLASGIKEPRLRAAGQRNALVALSYVNPSLAMQMLPDVSFAAPTRDHLLFEDVRATAAEGIFTNFLEKLKPQGLSTVTDQARNLGKTGQYPYRAMASIINHFPNFKGEANDILNTALSFYTNEAGFLNRDEEFFVLLRTLKYSAIDRNLMARALRTFVHRLTHDEIQIPGNYYSEIRISDGDYVPFTDRNRAFLFLAFPAIRQFDSSLAEYLLQEHPELARASEGMQYISGGFVTGNRTSEQARQRHNQWLQESLLSRVREERECNPQSAAEFAQRLTDDASRIIGFAWIVHGISLTNLTEARKVYYDQTLKLKGLKDSFDQLHATVAMADAAYFVGDSQYETLSGKSLDLGIALFTRDRAAPRVQRHQGFEQLQELATFSASRHADVLRTKIQRLPDNWLKAYLLLYEAEGRTSFGRSPSPAAVCSN